MDSSKKYDNPNPRIKANPLSKLVFWWLRPLFQYGKKHDLEMKDLYNVVPEDTSGPLGDTLETAWNEELERAKEGKRKPKLIVALRKTYIWAYAIYGGWILFLTTFVKVVQPFMLGLLIQHFAPQGQSTTEEAYMYASAVIVLAILNAFISHHTCQGQAEVGMRVRIACSSLIYRKILRLSRAASGKTAAGQVVNLLSNDVSRFEMVGGFLHYIWIMPIQVALITYLIYRSVGLASLAGVFSITIQTIPLQGYLSRLTAKLRMKIAIRTDERVRLMSEIISGIQVIKMYTWEKPFEKLVSLARAYEVDVLTLTSYLRGFYLATMVFTERTTLFFTIMAYVLSGNEISADATFSMAQYFNILQCTMAIFYPLAVSMLAETLVSIRRLEHFLALEENIPMIKPCFQSDDKNAITIKNVIASWTGNSITNTLHRINIDVNSGKLYAIVGSVGAGKSSLLQLILGELPTSEGTVHVNGTIAYASQEPWLFSGSVRTNLLFGQPFDNQRYQEVTKVCALHKDFEQLPQGDKTLIGDRGSSLSGGQRARLNLARAVYREADIYLLDDPLSAVDTHVGKQLFNECMNGYLRNKTRILVTHQIQYLKDADWIVVLKHGQVDAQGTFEELQKTITNFTNMLNDETEESAEGQAAPLAEKITSDNLNLIEDNDVDEEPEETAELIAKGGVNKSLYWKYFRAGGSPFMIFFVVFTMIVAQLCSSGADYWVSYWTKQNEMKLKQQQFSSSATVLENSTGPTLLNANVNVSNSSEVFEGDFLSNDAALTIYGILITGSVLITTLRSILFYKVCMEASKSLHNLMFTNILKAPMRFFDTNPSGRILNRFSKDIGAVDEILPRVIIESLQIILVMIGILTQVIVINWWMIFPMLMMGFLYYHIKNFYISTAQDLKRLEGNAKSPVFSHVTASLNGLATIRASGADQLVKKEFDVHQDGHTTAFYLVIVASTSFGFWLDVVSILFISCVTYSFIVLDTGNTFAGDVGLAISQSLILCSMLQHGVRQMAETMAQMTSVERILQYTKLEKEGPFDSEPSQKPPLTWPKNGRLQLDHMYMRYVESDPPVLKDLNFVIKTGMKVGVVGRTGAGKSSLIGALFRLAKLEGKILLDELDTQKIGLHDLRSKISIIPQEPVLFSASVRDNLDPFHKYEDAALWQALEDVELKNSVQSLDQLVNEGGSNFSAGQRQLVCLARAILRNNKILVLDEATANVDPDTDALIQTTIRKKFKECTVITIAHRLNTVMDSDRVLVMDHGEMIEFDHPHVLLQNKDGYFTSMVEKTGRSMSEEMRRIAKEAHESIVEEEVPLHTRNGGVST